MLRFLTESLLVLFESGTVITVLLIMYLTRQVRFRLHPPEQPHNLIRKSIWLCVFVATTLGLAHFAVVFAGTLQAFLVMAIGLSGCAYFYFKTLAVHVEGTSIRYVLFVWITLSGFLTALLGIIAWGMWRAGDLLSHEDFLDLTSAAAPLIQVIGILVAALGLIVANVFTSQQERNASARSVYQALEFGAIDLFRFENDNPQLVQALWFNENQPNQSDQQRQAFAHHLEQYACQYINLFEMAVRLRIEEVVPAEVFASWVPWMYQVCGLEVFATLWRGGLRLHYIHALRDLIDKGVDYAENDDGTGLSTLAERFYDAAASTANMNRPCEYVHRWLAEARRAAEPSKPVTGVHASLHVYD